MNKCRLALEKSEHDKESLRKQLKDQEAQFTVILSTLEKEVKKVNECQTAIHKLDAEKGQLMEHLKSAAFEKTAALQREEGTKTKYYILETNLEDEQLKTKKLEMAIQTKDHILQDVQKRKIELEKKVYVIESIKLDQDIELSNQKEKNRILDIQITAAKKKF